MYDLVRQYKPQEWDNSGVVRADVNQHSEEYRQLVFEVKQALCYTPTIKNIIRVQDLHSYGQFLIREQLLSNESTATLYKVRRYISVEKYYLSDVIKYNLDPRRCGKGQTLIFSKRLNIFNDSSNIICVVKVLTSEPQANEITPTSSTEYYVEYIIEQ